MTDKERLDKLEKLILDGTIIWDGKGPFPCRCQNCGVTISARGGLSLMDGKRTLREAADQIRG